MSDEPISFFKRSPLGGQLICSDKTYRDDSHTKLISTTNGSLKAFCLDLFQYSTVINIYGSNLTIAWQRCGRGRPRLLDGRVSARRAHNPKVDHAGAWLVAIYQVLKSGINLDEGPCKLNKPLSIRPEIREKTKIDFGC